MLHSLTLRSFHDSPLGSEIQRPSRGSSSFLSPLLKKRGSCSGLWRSSRTLHLRSRTSWHRFGNDWEAGQRPTHDLRCGGGRCPHESQRRLTTDPQDPHPVHQTVWFGAPATLRATLEASTPGSSGGSGRPDPLGVNRGPLTVLLRGNPDNKNNTKTLHVSAGPRGVGLVVKHLGFFIGAPPNQWVFGLCCDHLQSTTCSDYPQLRVRQAGKTPRQGSQPMVRSGLLSSSRGSKTLGIHIPSQVRLGPPGTYIKI